MRFPDFSPSGHSFLDTWVFQCLPGGVAPRTGPGLVVQWGYPHSFFFFFNFFFFFLMWTTFKVFIEFVTILFLFYVLVFWPRGMWDLSSPTRDRTHTPCTGRRNLNHWTTREVPYPHSLPMWSACPSWPMGPVLTSAQPTKTFLNLGIYCIV